MNDINIFTVGVYDCCYAEMLDQIACFSCENMVWIYTDPPFCFAQDYDYITTEENFVGNTKNFSSIDPTNNILLDDDCVMVFPISASSAAARFL